MQRDHDFTLEVGSRLGEFEGKSLLVWGDSDEHFPPSLARRLRDALADAQLVPVPGASTYVCLDAPVQLAQAIRDFLPSVSLDTDQPTLVQTRRGASSLPSVVRLEG